MKFLEDLSKDEVLKCLRGTSYIMGDHIRIAYINYSPYSK